MAPGTTYAKGTKVMSTASMRRSADMAGSAMFVLDIMKGERKEETRAAASAAFLVVSSDRASAPALIYISQDA